MFNMFISFFDDKRYITPYSTKTHIGKYRTFPDNLQTAERKSKVSAQGSACPNTGGKVQRARHC